MTLKQTKRTLTIITLIIAIGTISVLIGIQISTNAQTDQSRSQIPPGSPSTQPRRVVQIEEPEWRQDIPLGAKVAQSKVVAIGVPVRNVSRWSPDGSQVTTDYDIQIQEVIKGDVQPDSLISVSMPGGLVTESDRSLLEVRARYVRKMQNGKTYVLFLKNAPANGNSPFTTVRGSQGLYEIPQSGSRVIHLGRSFELAPADDGELISVFLQQVRGLVRSK
jgi:hypothetical protein